ncbi:MAG: hypoxanthine phosphoribosyltransferase [Bdellovibrionaceae bacterium]|nr:hypoxanthine phosphoribosyltransferase [Pseudobdellovibrionaceae bacterium]
MSSKTQFSTLYSAEQIQKKVKELGAKITKDFKGKAPEMLCILKGASFFYADLIREINLPLSCNFFGISSYSGTKSTGNVKITLDLISSIKDKDVIIVEDIVDTGLSLEFIINYINSKKPKSITVVSLLYKPKQLKVKNIRVDYHAFEIDNQFVVGYGLDYDEAWRELPFIAQMNNFN